MSTNDQPQIYYVLFHTPGPAWVAGVDFRQQPGVMDHVSYMASFLEGDRLVIGGPFLDNTGGMMVMRAESQEAAEEAANADPAVKGGLLRSRSQAMVRPDGHRKVTYPHSRGIR